MVWRKRVIFTRSSRAALSTGRGAGAAAGAAATFTTSSFMIRPSRPLPFTDAGSIPFSAMIFLADGASSTSFDAGAAAAGASALAGAAVGAAATAPVPSTSVASRASTPTVSPSPATISPSTPAAGEGTSTVTLSVSSSQSISSTATASPGFLNQVATVASVTDSPRVGTRISVIWFFLQWSAHHLSMPLAVICVIWPARSPVRPPLCAPHNAPGWSRFSPRPIHPRYAGR